MTWCKRQLKTVKLKDKLHLWLHHPSFKSVYTLFGGTIQKVFHKLAKAQHPFLYQNKFALSFKNIFYEYMVICRYVGKA